MIIYFPRISNNILFLKDKSHLGEDTVDKGIPLWLSSKEFACHAGDAADVGSIPGSGRSPGAGRGNPLQYSSLEDPRDRGAWLATVHGFAKSLTLLKRLSTQACTHN